MSDGLNDHGAELASPWPVGFVGKADPVVGDENLAAVVIDGATNRNRASLKNTST